MHYELANKGQSDVAKHKVADSESGAKKSNSLSKGEHQTFKKSTARGSHGANHRMANMAKKANISKVRRLPLSRYKNCSHHDLIQVKEDKPKVPYLKIPSYLIAKLFV